MKVDLPVALEKFVSSQVESGEFDSPNAVVTEGVRLLRQAQEERAVEEMRAAFDNGNAIQRRSEPTPRQRARIGKLIQSHRRQKRHE